MDTKTIDRDLLRAVEDEDLQKIESIFQLPALQSAPDWSILLSSRPIEFACEEGHAGIVEFLLKRGYPEDYSRDPNRTTLLHRAVNRKGNKNLETAKVLCNFAAGCGGDDNVKRYVNIQDDKGKTALHHAAEKSDLSIIDFLLEVGADVIIQDADHLCAAQIACVARKYETMKRLFESNKAWINSKMTRGVAPGSTCLQLVSKRNSRTAIKYLLDLMESENTADRDDDRMMAWQLACNGSGSSSRTKSHSFQNPPRIFLTPGYGRNVSIHRNFPMNLEATITLVAHEFGPRERNVPFAWDIYSLPGGVTCYSFRLNHFRGIYALLGKLLDENAIQIQDVKRFTDDFEYEQYIVDPEDENTVFLKVREPSCTVPYGNKSLYFTIAMPYFKVMTERWIQRSRVCEGLNHPLDWFSERYRCCPSMTLESLKDPYLPLTLDEYCCPTLPRSMLDRRNKDQVLFKATKNHLDSPELVTVCQLWSLQFDKGLVVAYERDGMSGAFDSEQYFPSWAHDCATGDIKRYIGIMLAYFIESLDRPCASKAGSGNPILNTFENFIARTAQEVDEYSRRKNLKKFDIDKERNFLHDIDDIRGELIMIKRVLQQQEDVWKTFASNAWPEHWRGSLRGRIVVENDGKKSADEWHLILRAQSQFDRYRRRIAQLDEDAARIEKSIIAKLDLKQKHASLQEAHSAAVMSAAVLGFTVITIIFTPLSFLTSLFALSIDRFQKSQVDLDIPNRENEADSTYRTRVYTTNYIGKWAATTELVSITVSLLAMWLVIEYGMGVPVLRNPATTLVDSVWPYIAFAWRYIKSVWRHIGERVFGLARSTKSAQHSE